jgi:hypothetical protein
MIRVRLGRGWLVAQLPVQQCDDDQPRAGKEEPGGTDAFDDLHGANDSSLCTSAIGESRRSPIDRS